MAASIPELNRNGGQVIRPIPYADALSLAATVAETYTLPYEANFVMFDFALGLTDSVWANLLAPAAIPSSDVTGGANAFKVSPGVAYSIGQISGVKSISLVSSANTVVSVQCFK